MTDVLTIARERQGELRQEIAELDEFIRTARRLLRGETAIGAGTDERKPESHGERVESAAVRPATTDARDDADEEAEDTPAAAEASEDAEDADSDSEVRRFPWTGMQPAGRRASGDDTYPPRRNVFRRDMSAAG